jgi:uncharacterized protein YcbK (DUF882 family)
MSETPQARLNRKPWPGPDWRAYRVTPHFRMGEFYDHQVGEPPTWQMHAVRNLCLEVLEPLRRRYGVAIVISGHRTPARNAAVGGAPRSFHVYEWHPGVAAADVTFKRGRPSLWAERAAATTAGGIGLYRRHLHVDLRSERVSWTDAKP